MKAGRTSSCVRSRARTHRYGRIGVYCVGHRCVFLGWKTNTSSTSVHATTTKSSPRDGEKKGRSNLSLAIAAFCRYVLPYNAAISSNLLVSLSLSFPSLFHLFSSIVNYSSCNGTGSRNSSAFHQVSSWKIEMIRGSCTFSCFRRISFYLLKGGGGVPESHLVDFKFYSTGKYGMTCSLNKP